MLHSTNVSTVSTVSSAYKRHILVAVDLSDQSHKAMLWAVHEFYRPGDCIQLVHVDRVLQPQMTIQHAFPGSTYTIPDLNPINEVQHGHQVVEVIKARFCSVLDESHIPWVLHLYLDTDNAPASAVAATLFKVAEEIRPVLLVLAAHNKAYGWNELLLGSVADYCMKNCTAWPVMLVRDYHISAPPMVIPAASSGHVTSLPSPAVPSQQDDHSQSKQAAAAAATAGPTFRLPIHSPANGQGGAAAPLQSTE